VNRVAEKLKNIETNNEKAQNEEKVSTLGKKNDEDTQHNSIKGSLKLSQSEQPIETNQQEIRIETRKNQMNQSNGPDSMNRAAEETGSSKVRTSVKMNANMYASKETSLNEKKGANDDLKRSREAADSNRNKVNEQSNEKEYKPSIKMSKEKNALSSELTKRLFEEAKREEKSHQKHQLDIDAEARVETFNKFTNKHGNRVEHISFDDIIRPYNTSFGLETQLSLDSFETTLKRKLYNKEKRDLSMQSVFGFEFASDSDLDLTGLADKRESMINRENSLIKSESTNKLLFAHDYIDIDDILDRALFKPIQLQNEIVNLCLLNYFLIDLCLQEHLSALRMYFFLESGEFSQTFVDHLCEKLFRIELTNQIDWNESKCHTISHMLNPVYVVEAVSKAKLASSKSCPFAERLSIRVINNRSSKSTNEIGAVCSNLSSLISFDEISMPEQATSNSMPSVLSFLNCVEMSYKIEWPLNIVVSEASMSSYNKIFSFMLYIKFVLSSLNNVWHHLKRLSNTILIVFIILYFLKDLFATFKI
jgi:hypothetical protein